MRNKPGLKTRAMLKKDRLAILKKTRAMLNFEIGEPNDDTALEVLEAYELEDWKRVQTVLAREIKPHVSGALQIGQYMLVSTNVRADTLHAWIRGIVIDCLEAIRP